MTLIRSVLISYLNLYVSVLIGILKKINDIARLPLFFLFFFFYRLWGYEVTSNPMLDMQLTNMDELGLQVYLYAATCWLHITKAAAQHSANVTK